MIQSVEPGTEAKEAFMRIYYAKIKYNKDNETSEIIDNFNTVSFSSLITQQDSNYMIVQDVGGDNLFSIVKTGESQFSLRSPWGESLGEVLVEGKNRPEGPICAEITTNKKEDPERVQVTRMPLITKSNEFQVTHKEYDDAVGRINIVRNKAVISMQPELDSMHRIRIVATGLIFLQIYNNSW